MERRHLNGVNDKGDLSSVTADGNGIVIEWRNTSRMNVAEHLCEAAREAENAGASIDVVIQHRAGIGIETDGGMGRQLVFMTLADFAEILNIRNGRKVERNDRGWPSSPSWRRPR